MKRVFDGTGNPLLNRKQTSVPVQNAGEVCEPGSRRISTLYACTRTRFSKPLHWGARGLSIWANSIIFFLNSTKLTVTHLAKTSFQTQKNDVATILQNNIKVAKTFFVDSLQREPLSITPPSYPILQHLLFPSGHTTWCGWKPTEFKNIYAAFWVLNYFLPYRPFFHRWNVVSVFLL